MGKKKSGRCTYCLKTTDELTNDHVFPRSWYPKATPKDVEKWQVPCCSSCNNRFSKLEERLLQGFGLCLDKSDAGAAGVPDSVMRSVTPRAARDEKDRRAREGKKHKLLKNVELVESIPGDTLLGLGPHKDMPTGPWLVVESSFDDLEQFGRKVAKGLTFAFYGELVPDTHRAWAHPPVSELDQPGKLDILMGLHGKLHDGGPGIRVFALTLPDDPHSHWFMTLLWRRVKLYAAVLRRDDDLFSDESATSA